jgi:hypothetical protein
MVRLLQKLLLLQLLLQGQPRQLRMLHMQMRRHHLRTAETRLKVQQQSGKPREKD